MVDLENIQVELTMITILLIDTLEAEVDQLVNICHIEIEILEEMNMADMIEIEKEKEIEIDKEKWIDKEKGMEDSMSMKKNIEIVELKEIIDIQEKEEILEEHHKIHQEDLENIWMIALVKNLKSLL